VAPGDTVTVSIEQIGELMNPVVDEPDPGHGR
jgi:2-keto-4-pentenoate hydratase/2-oxohepta-3-ene-1,7-dioic acid hydratase in catechol pathway